MNHEEGGGRQEKQYLPRTDTEAGLTLLSFDRDPKTGAYVR